MVLQVWSDNRWIISRGESIKVKLTPNNGNNLVHVSATVFCQEPPSQTHWASMTEIEKQGKLWKIQVTLTYKPTSYLENIQALVHRPPETESFNRKLKSSSYYSAKWLPNCPVQGPVQKWVSVPWLPWWLPRMTSLPSQHAPLLPSMHQQRWLTHAGRSLFVTTLSWIFVHLEGKYQEIKLKTIIKGRIGINTTYLGSWQSL